MARVTYKDSRGGCEYVIDLGLATVTGWNRSKSEAKRMVAAYMRRNKIRPGRSALTVKPHWQNRVRAEHDED